MKKIDKYCDCIIALFLVFFNGRLLSNLGAATNANLPVQEVMGTPAMSTLLWVALVVSVYLLLKTLYLIYDERAK